MFSHIYMTQSIQMKIQWQWYTLNLILFFQIYFMKLECDHVEDSHEKTYIVCNHKASFHVNLVTNTTQLIFFILIPEVLWSHFLKIWPECMCCPSEVELLPSPWLNTWRKHPRRQNASRDADMMSTATTLTALLPTHTQHTHLGLTNRYCNMNLAGLPVNTRVSSRFYLNLLN